MNGKREDARFRLGRRRTNSRLCEFVVCTCAFLSLLLGGTRAVRGAAAQRSAIPAMSAAGPGLPFAIADFDGDQRPDLARVHAGQSNSRGTQYWIQLRLTETGQESIRVTAPTGGLKLAASDVNGDHAIDLVLSTVWLNRPVAILLNDGHGRFTTESPSAFPEAFRKTQSHWSSTSQRLRSAGTVAQSRTGVYVDTGLPQPNPQIRSKRNSRSDVSLRNSPLAQRGRSPPVLG